MAATPAPDDPFPTLHSRVAFLAGCVGLSTGLFFAVHGCFHTIVHPAVRVASCTVTRCNLWSGLIGIGVLHLLCRRGYLASVSWRLAKWFAQPLAPGVLCSGEADSSFGSAANKEVAPPSLSSLRSLFASAPTLDDIPSMEVRSFLAIQEELMSLEPIFARLVTDLTHKKEDMANKRRTLDRTLETIDSHSRTLQTAQITLVASRRTTAPDVFLSTEAEIADALATLDSSRKACGAAQATYYEAMLALLDLEKDTQATTDWWYALRNETVLCIEELRRLGLDTPAETPASDPGTTTTATTTATTTT